LSSSRRAASISQADFTPIEIDDDDWSALMKSTLRVESEGSGILPGFSTASLRQSAAKSLDESTARLTHRASLSAAAAAIDALRLIGQSIDTSHGDGLATTGIESSLVAIREAEDFVGRYGHIDTGAISRMVRSHETKVLKDFDTSQLTGIIAADVYLDSARQTLSSIAIADPLAAHAIALLAKSYRQRATETPLALATSVHLMRAAAAAVPDDRGLAIELASVLEQAKLYAESQTVMAKAMQISSPNEMRADSGSTISVVSGKDDGVSSTKQAIQIEQLSPELFASVSRPEGGPTGHDSAGSRAAKATESATEPAMEGNPVSRAFKSMTRMWR
jgi:hypothetical protein